MAMIVLRGISRLRVLLLLFAACDHDVGYSARDSKTDTAHERGELPPVGVHTELDVFAVADGELDGAFEGGILGDLDLLRGDREVTLRGHDLFDPYVAEGQTVNGKVAHPIDHEVGVCAVTVRVEEVAAVVHTIKGEIGEAETVPDLETEARAAEGIAGFLIDLVDDETGGSVHDGDLSGIADTVVRADRYGNGADGDVALGSVLEKGVFADGQVAELDVTVFVGEEALFAAVAGNAPAVLGHDGLDDLAVRVHEGELNARERLAGEGVDLVDNEGRGLIGDVGIAGDIAVLIDIEAVGLIGESVARGSNGLDHGVVTCGDSGKIELTVPVRGNGSEERAVGGIDLKGRAFNGTAAHNVGLLDREFVLVVITLEHDGVFVLGGDNDVDDLIVDNVTVGSLDLTDVVGADGKIDGYSVPVRIGGHGAVHNARVVEYLEHSAGETDVGVLIQLPDRDVSFEHVVDDRVREVVHVLDVLGIAREVNGIGLGGKPDGGIGYGKLADVVVTSGQIVLRGRCAAVVGDEHLYEGIHGQDTDSFRGIEAEHEVRAAYGVEGEGLVVPLFGHLAELERYVLTVVEHLDGLNDNGSIAVLIADRYGIEVLI